MCRSPSLIMAAAVPHYGFARQRWAAEHVQDLLEDLAAKPMLQIAHPTTMLGPVRSHAWDKACAKMASGTRWRFVVSVAAL